MKSFLLTILFVSALILPQQVNAQEESPYQYVYPKPNSIMVSNETNIILRHADKIQESTVNQNLISVVGSKSGNHTGDFLLSDDNQTIVFNTNQVFAFDEVVTVSVQQGIKSVADNELAAYSFSFTTESEGIIQLSNGSFGEELVPLHEIRNEITSTNKPQEYLPPPAITIDSVNNPSSGYIFMATWDRNVPHIYGNYLFILDSAANIVDSVRVNGAPYDFKVRPNGLLTHALGNFAGSAPVPGEELQHIVRDSTLAVIDSIKMKNGYTAGFHDFRMLPNGHVLMYSFHTIIYDMSQIVAGGLTDALLVINILQEQDLDRNVVFEWRNIDHIPITESDLDLTASRVNYGTLNAFTVDNDGNILASFRNHSEIMKINKATGEVMWRMGSPRGEFTFIGEHQENAPYYFARQHNIERLPNGNISLFDNGAFHTPPYSRGVEYTIDEVNKTATLVSEIRYPNGNIFTATSGNAQKLPDGGWFLGHGVPHPQFVKRNAVEYHPDGSIALEFSLPTNVMAYRVYKFPWKELIRRPSFTHFEVLQGNTYSFNDATDVTGVSINYIEITGYYYNLVRVTRLPFGPVNAEFSEDVPIVYPASIKYESGAITSHVGEIHIDLSVYPEIINPSVTSLFIRPTQGEGEFTLLPTTYDSQANELIATVTSFGEIVFGEADGDYTANPPIPFEPMNAQRVLPLDSLALRWTGQGHYNLFQVQVSTDSTLGTVVIDSVMNPSFFMMRNLINNTTNFWRVRSILGTDTSDWSPIWRFHVTDAYIEMSVPNGGEVWAMGTSQIIRWETNISDSVRIDLLNDQQFVMTIDTTRGNPSAFDWMIPTNLTVGPNYKIVVVSMEDGAVVDTSEGTFSIDPATGIETQDTEIPDEYKLSQNYPNPFNPLTSIEFAIPNDEFVNLTVYNMLGKTISTLVNERMPGGNYEVNFDASDLSSGVYFYRLTAGSFVNIKKMVVIK
ncbi:MAG: aryl-sulfate sulfotransferase [Ignavibacteria bacterium]|jgi:hypothetical protein